jgi:hypothetical protein
VDGWDVLNQEVPDGNNGSPVAWTLERRRKQVVRAKARRFGMLVGIFAVGGGR